MSTKRKVYTFYIIAILVMVSALMLFNLNIIAKAIIGLLIVFCIFVMRSIQTAYHLPDDIDPDTMQPIDTSVNTSAAVPTAKLDHNSYVDLYLRLLIEADEELAKDPTIDQMSPSYNIQLNNRIAERLESLDRDKNKYNKGIYDTNSNPHPVRFSLPLADSILLSLQKGIWIHEAVYVENDHVSECKKSLCLPGRADAYLRQLVLPCNGTQSLSRSVNTPDPGASEQENCRKHLPSFA